MIKTEYDQLVAKLLRERDQELVRVKELGNAIKTQVLARYDDEFIKLHSAFIASEEMSIPQQDKTKGFNKSDGEGFNTNEGRELALSLKLLHRAICTMPAGMFQDELCKIYWHYRSLIASMGRLVPPIRRDVLSELTHILRARDYMK